MTGPSSDQDTRGACPHSAPSLLSTVHGALPMGMEGPPGALPPRFLKAVASPRVGSPFLGPCSEAGPCIRPLCGSVSCQV